MPYNQEEHGPKRIVGKGFHEQVFRVVDQVPRGFVTTYGDVAAAIGLRRAARQVGFALAALPPNRKVPWQRVVNRLGQLTSPDPERQARALKREGIAVCDGRVVDFDSLRLPPETLTGPD